MADLFDIYVAKKLSGGGGGGAEPLIVNDVYDESTDEETLDKTWQEIYDAAKVGKTVIAVDESINLVLYLSNVEILENGIYEVVFGGQYFKTLSASGYPTTGTPT